MTDIDIYPYGQGGELPAGIPIVDNLNSTAANKALSAKQGKVLKEMASQTPQQSTMPVLLQMGDPTEIIYTIDDFMLAHEWDESQGIDNLKFSNNLGKSWTTVENTFGIIVNVFMFADGTLMFAAKKTEGCRIYWTRDFSTFSEATVIDYDGSAYSPVQNTTRFFTLEPSAKHVYVEGVEHYCFWDYIISTTKPRAWYAISDENGVTVRAAFAFGIQDINGNYGSGVTAIPARHVHGFLYNPYNKYFYILTGDSVSECHVMRGRYVDNNGTHTWTWEKLATGGGYKLTTVKFDEGNLYALTDYTESALSDYKGIVSIPIDKIHLTKMVGSIVFPAKLRYWFRATSDVMAGSGNSLTALTGGVVVDNHGWKITGTDYQGRSKHPIAKGGHNFVWVDNDSNLKFGSFIGPNNQGDIIITASPVGSTVSGENWLKMSHKLHYNLTEIMRRSGATDFFEGYVGTPY